MYTLIYLNGHFNKPDTLVSFLQSNVGQSPLLRVDCVTPYQGTEKEITNDVCDYLNKICHDLNVIYTITQNVSTEKKNGKTFVIFLVIQIHILEK